MYNIQGHQYDVCMLDNAFPKDDNCLQEVSWRSRIASLQKSDLLGLTQPAGTLRPQTSGQERSAEGESESDRIARERRRARARRRAQRAGDVSAFVTCRSHAYNPIKPLLINAL